MSERNYQADGHCPYCVKPFHKKDLLSGCQAVECPECRRWFAVKTTITVETLRIEGEVTRFRAVA